MGPPGRWMLTLTFTSRFRDQASIGRPAQQGAPICRLPHPITSRSIRPRGGGGMATKRFGLSVPLMGVPLHEHREALRRAEQAGYTDLWSLEVDATDAFTPL